MHKTDSYCMLFSTLHQRTVQVAGYTPVLLEEEKETRSFVYSGEFEG